MISYAAADSSVFCVRAPAQGERAPRERESARAGIEEMAGGGAAGGFVTRAFESMLKECASSKRHPDLQGAIQSYIGACNWTSALVIFLLARANREAGDCRAGDADLLARSFVRCTESCASEYFVFVLSWCPVL